MALGMYGASVPVFTRGLNNLGAILDKAAAHCAARKIDPAVLLGCRLFPDMFPLTRQVQIATDHAKGAPARLAGVEIPAFADNEASFDDLRARLTRTLDFLKGFTPAQIDGSEDRAIELKIGGNVLALKGAGYLSGFALPNFYFHMTTAYNILRHNGVELGKRDFIGPPPGA
jgi:hypothetical protein